MSDDVLLADTLHAWNRALALTTQHYGAVANRLAELRSAPLPHSGEDEALANALERLLRLQSLVAGNMTDEERRILQREMSGK